MQEEHSYQYNLVKKIIDACGPRLPTSEEEKKAAEMLGEEIQKVTNKQPTIEKFICPPKGSIGHIPIYGYILMFISTPLLFFAPIACIILNVIILFIALMQIFRYTGFFDFLFPKGESQNVYTTLEPMDKNCDYTLIFTAHIDSSWCWNLALKNPKLMWIKIPYGIVGGVVQVFIAALRLILNQPIYWWMNFIGLLFVPGFYFLSQFLSWDKSKASPGAMDNLSGVVTAIYVVKYLLEHQDIYPNNARIILLLFGSEEAAIKGSTAYVKKHKEELKNMGDVFVINFDSVVDFEHFYVIDGDAWLGIKNDEELCQMAQKSMQEVGVKPALRTKNPVGGNDATSFMREDIKAVTLLAQNPVATTYYHTYNDNINVLDEKTFTKMVEVTLNLLEKIDNKYKRKKE